PTLSPYRSLFRSPNPTRASCFALMKRHGGDVSDAQSQNAALAACTRIWFLRMALERVQGLITVAKVIAGIEGLGYGYRSPSSYGNFFSAARHDGAAGVRIVKFFDSCSCFKFVTKTYRV